MVTPVIKIENVSKLYRLGEVGTGSLAHDFNRWWHKLRGMEDPYAKVGQANDRTQTAGDSDYAWALRDISFEVKQGEVLGIIGRNGAGKSTLLKILSRVTGQTSGRIKVKGRIASLLEVGTGFHPELTGRENIFLNGAILGMRKAEIARKFDEIVEFSGCARYIDTPVKRYSSGMYVRLAFAVAAHLEPEILIVDEVLAVGDAEFQKKCLGKMKDVASHGRTILFVSHNMLAMKNLCSIGCLLHNGAIVYQGDINSAISKYAALQQPVLLETRAKLPGRVLASSRDDSICLTNFEILDDFGNAIDNPRCGDSITFAFGIQMSIELKNAKLLISINDEFGTRITQFSSDFSGIQIHLREGYNKFACRIERFPLSPRDYSLDFVIHIRNEILLKAEGFCRLNVQSGDFYGTGKLPDSQWAGLIQIPQQWKCND
jgi:lipopolysaccharide transport system ATP-binding protein